VAETQTDGRTDRHNSSNSPFSQIFVRFWWNMYFLDIFSKAQRTFFYKFLVRKDRLRGTEITNRISNFCARPITNALHMYRRPAKFLAFLQTVQSISLYCLSGQHGYTRCALEGTNAFSNGKSQLQITRWNSITLNLTATEHVYTSYYVTNTSFLTLPIHYEVIIAQWTDEYW
jgi:hypothetical protein